MVYLVASGEQANAAAAAELPPVVSPASHSLFPESALVDARVSRFWSQGSVTNNSYIRSDLNRLRNGGLETFSAGTFASWESVTNGGGSTVTEETGIFLSGVRSAKLTVGAAGGSRAAIQQAVSVRTGSRRRGSVSLYAEAGATIKLEIRSLATGKYLDPTGAWVSSPAFHKTAAVASWTVLPFAYRVQTRRESGGKLAAIRYRIINETPSTVAYVDEVREWPEVNMALLAGHNVRPWTSVEFRSSTDGWVANDNLVGTLSPRETVMFCYTATPVTARHVAMKFTGSLDEAVRATEAFFGYADSPAESPLWGWQVQRALRQVRANDGSLVLSGAPEDGITMGFEPHPDEVEELEDFILRGLDGSMSIVIPSTTRDEVIVGRVPDSWGYRAISFGLTTTEIRIDPLSFPRWTP